MRIVPRSPNSNACRSQTWRRPGEPDLQLATSKPTTGLPWPRLDSAVDRADTQDSTFRSPLAGSVAGLGQRQAGEVRNSADTGDSV